MKQEKTVEIDFNSEEYKSLLVKSESLEPYHNSSSLHVHQEYYEIDDEKYSFLYAIGGDTLPIIEKIIDPTKEEINIESDKINNEQKYLELRNAYQFIKIDFEQENDDTINDELQYIIGTNIPYFIYTEGLRIHSFYKVRNKHILVEKQNFIKPSTKFYYIEDKVSIKLNKKRKLLIEILTNLKLEISKRSEIYKHGVDLVNYENYYSDSVYKLLAFIIDDENFSIDEIEWWLFEDVEKIYYIKNKEYNVEKVEDFVDSLLYVSFFKE